MTDLNKLKPCPFCGGEAESRLYDCEWFVQCIQCFNSTAADHAGEDEAVAAWNRRVEPDADRDQLRAEVEALRQDAARYRWLRDSCGLVEYKQIAGSIGPGMLPSGDSLQNRIDAVMGKKGYANG